MGKALERMRLRRTREVNCRLLAIGAVVAATILFSPANLASVAQSKTEGGKKSTWHSIEFGIVKFNDKAPNSWNIYHGEKKGLLLVRLWKRYLFVDVAEEEVYDIDPKLITTQGDAVEWSLADIPDKPIETADFKERNVGMVDRVQFRLGKTGHMVELQIPIGPTGKPLY
jgi:hypothetical protein